VKAALEQAKISVTVIDGDEEAELVYYGNRMAVKMSEKVSLIMDIGGGSTEFILANRDTIFWKKSFKLGAARLLDRFKPCDPITEQEISAFHDFLRTELQSLYEAVKQYQPVELIGSSGAFDSVVDLIGGEFNHPLVSDSQTEYPISLGEYDLISRKIKASTLHERYQMPYLINMRADMMVISVMLIDHVLKEVNLNVFKVSTFSLKEGVISKKLGLTVR
jgi:exopolyphosphatase/guanosine-5'-triphosphate,3'-diphosphate pyrophosphatase